MQPSTQTQTLTSQKSAEILLAEQTPAPDSADLPEKRRMFAKEMEEVQQYIAEKLLDTTKKIVEAALGETEDVTCEYAPSCTVTNLVGVPVFKDKAPDEMVLVKKTVVKKGSDVTAGKHLLDRILGKPVEKQEIEKKSIALSIKMGARELGPGSQGKIPPPALKAMETTFHEISSQTDTENMTEPLELDA